MLLNALLFISILAIFIPFLNQFRFLKSSPNVYISLTIGTAASCLALSLLQLFLAIYKPDISEINPILSISFSSNIYSTSFACAVTTTWFFVAIYRALGCNNTSPTGPLQNCYIPALFCATLHFAFSDNIATSTLFYEIISLIGMLAVCMMNTENSIANLKKYISLLILPSAIFLLPATIFTLFYAETITYVSGGIFKEITSSDGVLPILLIFFIIGISKFPIFPFFGWLPITSQSDYIKQITHSCIFAGVGSFFAFKILIDILGTNHLYNNISLNLLFWFSVISAIYSSIKSVSLSSIKLKITHTLIAQTSCVGISLSLFTDIGNIASFTQIISNIFSISLTILCLNTIYNITNSDKMQSINGVGKKFKILAICFVIGSSSLIGLPFTLGFIPKILTFGAIFKSNNSLDVIQMLVIALTFVTSVVAILPIHFRMFLLRPSSQIVVHHLNSGTKNILTALAILNVLLFFIGIIVCFKFI